MNEEINAKVLNYETFINDVLKEDLKEVHNQLQRKTTDLAEWVQLKTILNNFGEMELTEGFKTKMDIGTNIYVQVNVPDASKIIINIGSGIFVEYTIHEALKVIEQRIDLLNKQIAIIRKNSAQIKARIKLVLHGIQELSQIEEVAAVEALCCKWRAPMLQHLKAEVSHGTKLEHRTKLLLKVFIAVKINSEFHPKGIQELQPMLLLHLKHCIPYLVTQLQLD